MILKFFIALLFLITLFLQPLYPDEQVFQLISFNGIQDGTYYNNLAYFCRSFKTEIPLIQIPFRILTHFLFGGFDSPIVYRVYSILIFSLNIFLFIKYTKEPRSGFILCIGYIPFTLATMRPEGLILLIVISSLIVNSSSIKHKSLIQALLFAILLTLHARTIFLLPLYLYFIIEGYKNNRILIILLSLGIVTSAFQTANMYFLSFQCPENEHMSNIFKSLRGFSFDGDIFQVIKSAINKIIGFGTILEFAGIRQLEGTDPVPSYFTRIKIYQFYSGAVSLFFTVVVVRSLYLTSKSLLAKNIDWVVLNLWIFLFSTLIFQKSDRFYELSVWMPLILIILYRLKGNSEIILNYLKYFGAIAIFIALLFIFIKYAKGYGPYARILPLNIEVKKFVEDNYNSDTEKLIVGFDSFNYMRHTKSPILINFFFWYSENLQNGKEGDLSRIKYLYDAGSHGGFLQCSRMPKGLQDISNVKTLGKVNYCFFNREEMERVLK